jgi:SAM-dependent methyltransferase
MPLKVSEHYLGARGAEYVRNRQEDPLYLGYSLDFLHFAPYLGAADKVLDFGCGNAGLLRLLRRHVALAHGLEVNPAARAIGVASGATVFASLEEVRDAAFYDAIVTNHALEHVRDVCSTLESLRGYLKPGGLLIAKLPIDDFRSKHQRSWSNDDRDHHLATWTPRLFANVLVESGYSVRECRGLTSAWHPKLFPAYRAPFRPIVSYLTAVALHRRQLLAIGVAPVK